MLLQFSNLIQLVVKSFYVLKIFCNYSAKAEMLIGFSQIGPDFLANFANFKCFLSFNLLDLRENLLNLRETDLLGLLRFFKIKTNRV